MTTAHLRLSQRLLTLANAVPENARLVDVGTDHAYIPIHLLQTQRISFAIAADIAVGPLETAKQNIANYQLAHRIETRLSDGLAAIQAGEVDTVLIAGMGGQVQTAILEAKPDVVDRLKRIILQPMNAGHLVRKYLDQSGFTIVQEMCLEEDGRIYEVIIAEPAATQVDFEAEADALAGGSAVDVYAEFRHEPSRLQFAYEFGPLMLAKPNKLVEQRLERAVKDTSRILQLLTSSRSDVAHRRATIEAERDLAEEYLLKMTGGKSR